MTANDRYRGRIAVWTERHAWLSRRAAVLSRWRLITFFTAVVLLTAALRRGAAPLAIAAVAGFAAFAWLVVRHARVFDEIARSAAGIAAGSDGLARLARDWNALPEIPAPGGPAWNSHPYARDLDVYGHASLTKWLGAPATRHGARQLDAWLLEPAPPDEICRRQASIGELAAKAEWREALAIEGRLGGAARDHLDRFLEWAEATAPALPRVVKPLAVVLPAITWLLIAVSVAGVADLGPERLLRALLERPWWMLPVVVNLVISFAVAKRVYAVFDRTALGQQILDRYASMLALVCDETWQTPMATRIQDSLRVGGSAPMLVRRLARLAGWSELRTGAALLHVPIQALTLWDLHVLLALERWRRRAGPHVRQWLESLGAIDALATLSVVRADNAGWAMPVVDAGCDTLDARGLAHPLIADDRRVPNDVSIGPPGTLLLVTGSNMSGKSTLLRAVGLNAVLAQAGAPVCASAFRMPPADVHTSIRVEDSLEHGLSSFMAALARLKRIVDAAERQNSAGDDQPRRVLLYLLDEVLQGTNSVERSIAVRAIARHLLGARAIGAITTHDLALAADEPIEAAAVPVHFTEHVDPAGAMTFDYILRPGLATSRNAVRLMQLMGIRPA